MEKLVRYIIRASFSHERLTYLPEMSQVVYAPKDGEGKKVFSALEWLPEMCSHIPDRGEQMVRYHQYYITSAGKNGKKQKRTGFPASWNPIEIRRDTERTGP